MTADENYRLLCEIEMNREFLLSAYRQNPDLLALAEPRIRILFGMMDPDEPIHEEAANCHREADRPWRAWD